MDLPRGYQYHHHYNAEEQGPVVKVKDDHHQQFVDNNSSSNFGDCSSTMTGTTDENSDYDRPPVDFQVASDSDEECDSENFDQLMMTASRSSHSGVFLADQVRCPLCERWKRKFICKECLLKGDFNLSNPNKAPPPPVLLMEGTSRASNNNVEWKELRYVDLKMGLLYLQHKRSTLVGQCEPYAKRKEILSNLINHIEQCRETIRAQKQLKVTLQAKIIEAKRETEALRKKTLEQAKFWPICRSRLNNMETQYKNELKSLDGFNNKLKQQHQLLKARTKHRIMQLRDDIFLFQEIDQQPKSPTFQREIFGSGDSWSDEDDDTVNALIVARSHWGRSDAPASSSGTLYSVVGPLGPTLPTSGDYSAYAMWTERNQGVTSGSSNARDPSHTIAAALTYTTLFVNVVAYYLDRRLPCRISYSDFANADLALKFNRRVAKLNANIVYLCASQGIAPTFLQPRKSVSNLHLLFDQENADLGRREPFKVSSQLAKLMEDSFEKDLLIFGDDRSESDSDWNDSFPSDWENVQKGALEEYGLHEMTSQQSYCQNVVSQYQNDSFLRSRNTASMTGGLVSSFTSFFRGWRK